MSGSSGPPRDVMEVCGVTPCCCPKAPAFAGGRVGVGACRACVVWVRCWRGTRHAQICMIIARVGECSVLSGHECGMKGNNTLAVQPH